MSWLFGSPHAQAKRLVAQLKEASKASEAAQALLRLGKDALPALLEALRSPDETLRARARAVLIQLGREATPLLISQLNTAPPLVQVQLCEVFVKTQAREALPALIAALHHPDEAVRLQAAQAIGRLGDTSILPALLKVAQDASPEVRVAAVVALGYFPQAVKPLCDLLRDDPKMVVRRAAARALGGLRDPSSLPALLEALEDGFWWYEREREVEDLLQAIAVFGPLAVEPLIQALNSRERAVRRLAAILLGRIGDRRALEPLGLALYDLHFEVGDAAAEALTHFGAVALDIFEEALRHPEAALRERAVRALGKIAHPRAGELLLGSLEDPEEQVRLQTIQSLVALKERRALPILQAMAEDRSQRALSQAARMAIEAILRASDNS